MLVRDEESEDLFLCSMPGKFKLQKIRPIVGDLVEYTPSHGKTGRIENILPQKNLLKRPRISNIDQIVLVNSLVKPKVSTYIIDKFLVLSEKAGIDTIIVFNKVDLLGDHRELDRLIEMYGDYYKIILTSTKKEIGLDKLKDVFKNKTSTLAGMSGVGKSSLLNKLDPKIGLKVAEISSRLERGKHTTTHVELLSFKFGGLIADTPGFSNLYLGNIAQDELKNYYRDMKSNEGYCAFSDCLHLEEPGCYIKELIESGDFCPERYENYKKMYLEIEENFRGGKVQWQ